MDMKLRYDYIAQGEPYASLDVLGKYGYSLQGSNITTQDVADALDQMVLENGEPALTDVMAIHPDREIIVELFGNGKNSDKGSSVSMPHHVEKDAKNFLNNPTNAVLLGIGVILAIVVIKS